MDSVGGKRMVVIDPTHLFHRRAVAAYVRGMRDRDSITTVTQHGELLVIWHSDVGVFPVYNNRVFVENVRSVSGFLCVTPARARPDGRYNFGYVFEASAVSDGPCGLDGLDYHFGGLSVIASGEVASDYDTQPLEDDF